MRWKVTSRIGALPTSYLVMELFFLRRLDMVKPTTEKERPAIITGLCSVDLRHKRVVVYGSDVELFVLLIAHYQNIGCQMMFMKSLAGYTS